MSQSSPQNNEPENSGRLLFSGKVREASRLRALRRYETHDTEPEVAFDRLTDLAAEAFDVEIAFVVFLDTNCEGLESSVGLTQTETELAGALCTCTVEDESLLVIEDAVENDRLSDNPFVTEEGLRFYAGVPLLAPDGTAIGTFSIMDSEPRDLSDQERERLEGLAQMAIEELERRRKSRESEQEARHYQQVARRFEAVLEDPNMLAGVLSREGRLLEANETALRHIEETEEEVVGEFFWETPWWPEEMSSQIKEKVVRAAKGEYVEYEADLTDAEGRPYSVEGSIRPVRGAEGEVGAIVVSARDVTERKLHEKELRVFEKVFNQANDAIVVTEAEPLEEPGPRIEHVNKAFEQMTGYSEEEILGKTPRVLQGPETDRETLENLRRALKAGETCEGETVNYCKDGTPYRVRWSIAPVRGEDGKIERWSSVQQDVTDRRRRTRELERYERITENLPVGAFRTTVSGEFIEVNEALTEIYSCSEQELREAGTEALYVDPADREELIEVLREEGKVESRMIHMQTLAGEKRWIRATITLVEEDGERYLDGIVQDVTNEVWRKEQIERQNDLFRRAEEIAKVGAWEYDMQSETLRLTDQASRILGFSPREDVSLQQSYDHCHPEDRRKAKKALRRSVGSGTPYDIEVRVRTEEGEVRWVRCRGEPQCGPSGEEVVRVRGTLQDITKQHEREQALREREEKIGGLFEATRRVLAAESQEAVADRIYEVLEGVLDHPFVHVGLASEGVIFPQGTTAKGLSRKPETEPQPTDEDLVVTRALRAGEPVVVEDTGNLDNDIDYGSLSSVAGIPIEEHGAIVLGKEKQGGFGQFDLRLVEVMARYAALVLERLDREMALREAKEEAEEAARLKTAVLANMSHEIRTPLTPVIGFAESLAEDLDGPEAQVAERIKRSSHRLRQTLDSVLRLSQIEAGTFDLDREELDLREVVREVSGRFSLAASEKGLTFEAGLPNRPVWGCLSEGGVRRIVENLLENAVKFTPEGGRVAVRLRENPEEIVLQVEDTGIGISEECQEEIFETFQQESKGRARDYEGTGLGLSIVRRLAEAHGGSVNLESEKGEGSCFTVRLPTAGQPEKPVGKEP